jgi:two-component system sensor histidine kinase BarA
MLMFQLIENLKQAPLIRRVCLLALSFCMVLSVTSLVVDALWNFQDHKTKTLDCVKAYIDSEYRELSQLTWERNRGQVAEKLNRFGTSCAGEESAFSMFSWRIDLRDQERWLELGSVLQKQPVYRLNFPISHWEEQTDGYGVGMLQLTVSFHALFEEVSAHALRWVLINSFIYVITAVFGLLLGYFWLVKRSQDYMESVLSDSLDPQVDERAMLEHIASENSEISNLWKVVLRHRNAYAEKTARIQEELETALLERDKAVKDVESKNQFISSLSHELRTPMNGLIGFTALLSETRLDDSQKEYVNTMQASLESLLHVINDVLDLSRVESGNLHVNSIPFSFRSVVSGVTALLRSRANAKGIALETRIAPETPRYLRGDPARLRQILTNLVSNSIAYTERGHILVNLELIHESKDEAHLRLAIEDSGVPTELRGQSSSQLEQLGISRFSTELRDRRSISLDACEKLAALLGAQLMSENVKDKGASYWIDFKLPIVAPTSDTNSIDWASLDRVHALVLDGFELSRQITLEFLQGWGVEFDSLDSPKEVLEFIGLYTGPKWLLVLVDDRGQSNEGELLVRSLANKLGRKGSVIVVSSYPQLGDAERFFLAGASGFLSKQDRDPYLRDVMCQVYEERERNVGIDRRLVTRYTVQDMSEPLPAALSSALEYKVMVVEENIVNQQLIVRTLQQNSCHADIATTGFEAIELFKANRYDLILMDCHMPEMSGFETAQILGEIERSTRAERRVPIIAMFEGASDGDESRCSAVGMCEILDKPITLSSLKMVLGKYLR